MENICTQTLSSGVDRYRDYIMKSLSKGVCRSDILRGMREQGLICGNTAAYDYMNKLAAFYGIELIKLFTRAEREAKRDTEILLCIPQGSVSILMDGRRSDRRSTDMDLRQMSGRFHFVQLYT